MSKKRRKSKTRTPKRAWKARSRNSKRTGKTQRIATSRRNTKHVDRKKNAIFRNTKAEIMQHPYWSRAGLGDAVVAWVDYKIETTFGVYTEQRFNFSMIQDAANAHRLSNGKRNLKSIEVKKIADNICGYTTGDELFPEHLTREQALDHLEICEMIREYWASAMYTHFEAEDRYFIIKKHNQKIGHSSNRKKAIRELAKPSNKDFWNCGVHIDALANQKGDLIHRWGALCGKTQTAARGYHCHYCQKIDILMMANRTDRHRFWKRERDNAVTSFQITQLLQSRISADEIHALGLDSNVDPWRAMLRIIQECVARQANEREGKITCSDPLAKFSLEKITKIRYGSKVGDNTMNERILEKYASLYERLAEVLDDQDLTIALPEPCVCKDDCRGYDFITRWLEL